MKRKIGRQPDYADEWDEDEIDRIIQEAEELDPEEAEIYGLTDEQSLGTFSDFLPQRSRRRSS